MSFTCPYIGRFAPSPSGPLHRGSLVAALASYLDARAHHGQWRLRIEDVDHPRTVAGADRVIVQQLAALGMTPDGEILYQSRRESAYQAVFDLLQAAGWIYPCACTRRELAQQPRNRDGERPYPGTCRHGLRPGHTPRSWRLRVEAGTLRFVDRWEGEQAQNVARDVGDFVIRRADGLWAYQLAVVIDDVFQGVTDVVRGADLLSSTARQFYLFDLLKAQHPRVMHVPLLMDSDGRKLSKQNGAPALDLHNPLTELQHAWQALGFAPLAAGSVRDFHRLAQPQWCRRWGR